MTRLNILANGFACLAIVLLLLGVLAVPTQFARADDPECGGEAGGCPAGWECVEGHCVAPPTSCPNPAVNTCTTPTTFGDCLGGQYSCDTDNNNANGFCACEWSFTGLYCFCP
jgi:hypothetical protein